MSKQINDGGPAYPVSPEIYNGTGLCGMTLRDYFATAALQGLLPIIAKDYDVFFANKVAHACYETADAMLKAREMK
jgi:hypothetical protein